MRNEGTSKLSELPLHELITKTPDEVRSYVEMFIERHSARDIKATLVEIRKEVRALQDGFRSLSQQRIGLVHWYDMQGNLELLLSNYRAARNQVWILEEVERDIVSTMSVEHLNGTVRALWREG